MDERPVDNDDGIADAVAMWGLPPVLNQKVEKKLREIGVSATEDIEYIQPEKDLSDVLSTIQCRKIQGKIQAMIAGHDQPQACTPSPGTCESGRSDVSDAEMILHVRDASPSPSTSDMSESSVSLLSPSQNWTSSFKIPYHKFPPDLIDTCEKGERPKSYLRLEMIRILCAEIKAHTRLPGKKNLELIASRLCAKYPKSFCDIIGEEVLGNGVSSIVQQMSDRMVNAYGRGSKRSLYSGVGSEDANSPKITRAADYGCVNFDPQILEGHTADELQKMKHFLCEEALKPESERNNERDKLYMELTYALQRCTINRRNRIPSIKLIKEEWPLLFEYRYMMHHFKSLTGIDLEGQLKKSLSEKHERLINFISEKRSKTKGVKENLQKLRAVTSQETSMTDGLLLKLVTLCFGENPDLFIKEYEELTNGNEVEQQTKILTPHIAVIGDVLDPAAKLWLVVEKSVVTQNIKNLMDAISMVFAAYYVLNLSYDEGLVGTMEFIQRCLVNLNPCKGSKSAKKGHAVPNKVLLFINGLKAMDWNV